MKRATAIHHAAPAEAPEDLAETIEAVLSDKSYGAGRRAPAAAPAAPRPAAADFSADALMADLSAARQAKAAEPKPAKPRRRQVETAGPPRSLVDKAFTYAGLGLVLLILFVMTPWGRDLLAPVARLLD